MITESEIQGHWVRNWIKAPGFEDRTTRVHWMQAGADFADVRIPLERPDTHDARCLADLEASALLALAQSEGFAGHVTLSGNQCTWHREINWHGTTDTLDVGAISFDENGKMIEAGVLAEYTELWEQRAEEKTGSIRFGDDVYSGVLVFADGFGVVGIGRRTKPATHGTLNSLEAGVVSDETRGLFDGLHATCTISEETATAILATDPFTEGNAILTICKDSVHWHQRGFDGNCATRDLQIETVLA